jgi:predicted GNAT superfamily acetyltransferase
LDLANFLSGGAKRAYSTHLNAESIIEPDDAKVILDGAVLLAEIPSDIDSIREENPEIALAWRMHTRKVFETAFANGYIITDFVFLKGEKLPRSYYVLSHGEGTLG